MKHLPLLGALFALMPLAFSAPVITRNTVFEEVDGLIAVEAEHFFKQEKDDVRKWHLTSKEVTPNVTPDGDPNHAEGASGGAYLEILPDTRRTHDDKLKSGENFSNEAGKMAIVSYRVHINNPGKYYVWVRTHATGTEDNGIHVGLDGEWPASGQRMQWTTRGKWFWDSKQRTDKVHTGVPHLLYLDIPTAGPHTISFSMREDGFEFDKWLMTTDRDFKRPDDEGPEVRIKGGAPTAAAPLIGHQGRLSFTPTQTAGPAHGDGTLTVSGELKQWHKVTVTLDGPFAKELDTSPNPFVDYNMMVVFKHEDGVTKHIVPGYFAADGEAGESSASEGTKWRAHFAPEKPGKWACMVAMTRGKNAALEALDLGQALSAYHGKGQSFTIVPSDKSGRDFRGKGRLSYVGKHHLQFEGSKEYFLKAGADAPETLLAYTDFDGTVKNSNKGPLKTWKAHVKDWQSGDPTWKGGKGKGLIGALNYLSGTGCNAFSFLTYNAGGDGDNIWPFVERDKKLHYDCSKLDQWQIVFDHAQQRGLYLHFKLQETENDDKRGKGPGTQTCLDGGDLGPERKLYLRELIARFGYALALNWNLGEENTQSPEQQRAMASYIRDLDPYDHNMVIHTYPNQQDQVYTPLLGDKSALTGASLQNHWNITHRQTQKWISASAKAGRPWVVANDEQGSASTGAPPDPGYEGFSGKAEMDGKTYDLHDIRKYTLWGNLMAGGAGVEYYFGYKLPQNDLVCEDWRSRDKSWNYCRIALEFFQQSGVPFWDMSNMDELVGNPNHDNTTYCLGKKGRVHLVYLTGNRFPKLDLTNEPGRFQVRWFNPRSGQFASSDFGRNIVGGEAVDLGLPPADQDQDWLAIVTPLL